jgi:hypothetical protein
LPETHRGGLPGASSWEWAYVAIVDAARLVVRQRRAGVAGIVQGAWGLNRSACD